ncbi:hypothetical protein OQY15_17115 [Pedobacter sp. MC2016-15]|uniref:hypothetical protein n=1 Tax=Pedobacter sp. MC2016-15 TaxID=2994473 RepID=UPI0022482867|nr:hypothetical protein [Pedobacter sp. MC2016-15]MCX2480828.1 hypothetical protein [Pedobacter sp. MC2016-15]
MPNNPGSLYQRLFNFIEVEKPTYPLLFYRTGLALICIGKFAVLYHNFLIFYGQYGLIQWSISKVNAYPYAPHIGDYSIFLGRFFNISFDDAAMLVMKIFFCSSLCLFFGLFTRLSTFLCFMLHLAFINTGSGIIYGVEVFTQLALFYALFFPLNTTYSADMVLGLSKYKKESVGAGIAIRLVQFQMCLVYLSSGIEKCLGIQWLNGEAIWRTMMMPIFKHYDFSWMADYPYIPLIIGLSVLIVEIGYVVFMWMKNVRVWWLGMIIALHLGIGIFMGMWFFALVMVFLSVFAFGDDVIKDTGLNT